MEGCLQFGVEREGVPSWCQRPAAGGGVLLSPGESSGRSKDLELWGARP